MSVVLQQKNKSIGLSHILLGVTKQVGDALLLEGQQRTGRVVSIGIAPWGIVERNHELLGHNRDVPCHSISSPRSVDEQKTVTIDSVV